MNLPLVIFSIILICVGLALSLNFSKPVSNQIQYPTWVIAIKWSMLVIGISGFIFAAVLASSPQKHSVKICIYEQKIK